MELSSRYKEPFWITKYPVGSRGFYYRIDPKNERYMLSMDLLYPEGFGEASSGGERETNPKRVRRLLKESNENEREYSW